MDIVWIIGGILLNLALLVAGVALVWWIFRMVFWGAILFIGEAGRAWRGK